MEEKKCPRCGQVNSTSKSRCDNCGNILPLNNNEIICPGCSKVVDKSNPFCNSCGFSIKDIVVKQAKDAERSKVMANTRVLLKQTKEAEKSYKAVLELAKDKKNFILTLCNILSSDTKTEPSAYEWCLKDADIKIDDRERQRGVRIYPIAVVVQDDKWNRFCELRGNVGSRGFNVFIKEPPFGGINGVSFVKHEYRDKGTLPHELMHSSFRLYHSLSAEKHRKEAKELVLSEIRLGILGKDSDKNITLESPKVKFISHSLLSELNSWRSNVEKDKITWPDVYTNLAFGYLPPLLEIFPEISNDIKGMNMEEMNQYAGTEEGRNFNSFLHMIWGACMAMQEIEKRYDKWVIDRFLAKCDVLMDVIVWEKSKDYLDKLQARVEKRRNQEMGELKHEIGEKKEKDMDELQGEIEKKRQKEMDELREKIRKDREKGRF
jgi:hypothetical protein